MSQQERGRGRTRDAFGQRGGRGSFQSYSPQPPPPHFSEFETPPGSYHQHQLPSSGIPSVHSYPNFPVGPPPSQYPPHSVISVAVIQSPAPQPSQYAPSPGHYYSDRQPQQPATPYFQPNPSGPLPPRQSDYISQNVRPKSYFRDDIYTQNQPFQKQYHDRDNVADHFYEAGTSSSIPAQSRITRQEQDHRTSQQKYHGQQRTHSHHTGQQKYRDQQQRQGHDIPKSQKYHGSQQKRDHYSSPAPVSRGQSAPPQEPPPPYESLFSKSANEHLEKIVPQSRGTEHKTGKKFREGKSHKKSKDMSSQVLQPRPVFSDSSTSFVGDNSQGGQQMNKVRKDCPRLDNTTLPSKQGQSSQVSRGSPKNLASDKQYHKQEDKSSYEGFMPDGRDSSVKDKQNFKRESSTKVNHNRDSSFSSVEERKISSSSRGRGRGARGRRTFHEKSQQNNRQNLIMSDLSNQKSLDNITSFEVSESGKADNMLTMGSQFKSDITAEANKEERQFAQKKKSRARKKKTKAVEKAVHADSEPLLENPVTFSSSHITKASLQILTSFKDANSLKETVQLHMDESETNHLHFVDDSIICSEKRSVCTVMIETVNNQMGKRVIKNLCERLRKGLTTKVMFDISNSQQEQPLVNEVSQSKQKTEDNVLDCASAAAKINVSGTDDNEDSKYEMLSTVQSDIAEENITCPDKEKRKFPDKENSECVDEENNVAADDDDIEDFSENDIIGQHENDSEGSDEGNSEGLDEDSSEGSDEDSSEVSDEENSECSDEENSEGLDDNSEGSAEESCEGSDEENAEGLEEENNTGQDVKNNEVQEEGHSEDLGEENIIGLDKENSIVQDTEDSKNLTQIPTKLSVVVDTVFPVKADFLGFLSRIFGDKISMFELLPDSVMMATSTTLCEIIAPSKLAAKKLAKLANSSNLEGVQVRCFIVNDGSNLK